MFLSGPNSTRPLGSIQEGIPSQESPLAPSLNALLKHGQLEQIAKISCHGQ